MTEYERQGIESFYRKEGFRMGMKEGEKIGEKRGEKIGEKRGIDKGRLDAQRLIARNLKASGVSYDIIISSTGLSQQEIDSL